jgi:hypothetical protein
MMKAKLIFEWIVCGAIGGVIGTLVTCYFLGLFQ